MGVPSSRVEYRSLAYGALLSMVACVPSRELSDYSRGDPTASGGSAGAAGGGGSAGNSTSTPEAGVGGTAGSGAAGEAGNAGTTAVPSDASVPEDAAVDAAGDARSVLVQRCDNLGGVLEPGTTTCFLISGPPRPPLDWTGAEQACEDWGGSLVTIKSPERDAFLTVAVPRPVWIGARDPLGMDPTADSFRWVDDESLLEDGYTNWGPLEPDNTVDQFCVEKRDDLATDPWFDQPCSELKAYVCETAL